MFRHRVYQCLKLLKVFLLIQMAYYPTKGQECQCIGCDFDNVPAVGNEEDECNIENVSLGKHAVMSSQWQGMPANDAVNGITSGQYYGSYENNCANTGIENNPWWEVDLGRNYTISNITIYTMYKFPQQMENVQILIEGQLCNTLCKYSWNEVQHVDVICTTPRYGRHVKLIRNFNDGEEDKYISICEVQVWVQKCSCASDYVNQCVPDENCNMENVAMGKKAYMSSSHETGNPGQACVAVDGNTTFMQSASGDTPSPSCTYSGNSDNYPWWEVDLGDDYAIKRISVYTTPQFVEKLSEVEIRVDGNVLHTIINYSVKVDINVKCSHFCRGRRVMLTSTRNYYLAICEVQVWICRQGFYGDECKKKCGHCNGEDACDSVNGTCFNGCKEGFSGLLCQACSPGYYGVNCSTQCGNCADGNSTCDSFTGECQSGCKRGWNPPNCSEVCTPGYSGVNCSIHCGNCANGINMCDVITGECQSGCENGWNPPNCSEGCNPGYYGINCSTQCGNCADGLNNCDRYTGECVSGCQSGWNPPNCSEEVTGPDNSLAGIVGGVVAGVVIAILTVAIVFWIRHRRLSQKDEGRPHNEEEQSDNIPFSEMTHAGIKPKIAVKPQQRHEAGHECNYDHHVYSNTSDSKSEVSNERSSHLYGNMPPSSHFKTELSVVSRISPKKNANSSDSADKAETSNIKVSLTAKSEKPTVRTKPIIGRKPVNETKPDVSNTLEDEDTFGDDEEDVYNNEEIYSNFKVNNLAKLDTFQRSLLTILASGQLRQQFLKLPKGMKHPHEEGLKPINVKKNRFKALFPYDSNRVILEWKKGKLDSDYINASYIKGYQREKAYIAAQGPRLHTMKDMWWMVWQEGVTQIVMLTNLKEEGKEKCEEYWPGYGSTQTYGEVSVTGVNVEQRAHFIIRTFSLKVKGNELLSRNIQQYHYTAWPDHGVPTTSSLVNFWRYIKAHAAPHAPVLVHCSAGVGRTGTYIALDIAMETSERHPDVKVHKIVTDLREERTTMVQAECQYKFLYEVILEAYTSRGTRLSFGQFEILFPKAFDVQETNDVTDKEFKMLQQMGKFVPKSQHLLAASDENMAKNRNQDALPDNSHLAYLGVHVTGRNMYINAVFAPSFKHRKGVLLTQLPFPDTLVDIWRLVDDKDVNTIVSIGSKDEHIKVNDFCQYWPNTIEDVISTGPYTIRYKGSSVISDHITSFHLSLKNDNITRDIRLLHFTDWAGDVPENTEDILCLIETLSTNQSDQNTPPVVIQCIDGAARSGLLCILLEIIERAKCDHEIDIYLTARLIQAIRPQAITTEVQYRFCYKIVQDFQRKHGVYQNT